MNQEPNVILQSIAHHISDIYRGTGVRVRLDTERDVLWVTFHLLAPGRRKAQILCQPPCARFYMYSTPHGYQY